MCTNVALVDRLECYMDELVTSFEDFVKQSLVIITVAVGGVVVVLLYALKIVSERQPESITTAASRYNTTPSRYTTPSRPIGREDRSASKENKCSKSCKSNVVLQTARSIPKSNKSANTEPLSREPSYDEAVLSSVSLSACSKNCPSSTRSLVRKGSPARLMISSLPTNYTNRCVSPPRTCPKIVSTKKSCCSLCCTDEDTR